jgi:hypothetical protein
MARRRFMSSEAPSSRAGRAALEALSALETGQALEEAARWGIGPRNWRCGDSKRTADIWIFRYAALKLAGAALTLAKLAR